MNMKKRVSILLSTCLLAAAVLPSAAWPPNTPSEVLADTGESLPADLAQYEGYRLAWNDEFDGKYLDQTKWRLGSTPENGRHKYNTSTNSDGELENENVYLEDGCLQLAATDVEDYTVGNKVYVCNSGMVETLNKASWRYGRFDIRAKLPVTKGMWPAIWMMPEKNVYGWPKDGEIDIMELISQEKNTVYGTLHCGTADTSDYFHPAATYRLQQGTFFDDFHVFSMEWEPGVIRCYVDNILYATFDNWNSVVDGVKHDFPHPFDVNFYLKLNLAAGGSWCENPDDTTAWGEESTMSIDYVRVYKKTDPSYDYSEEAFVSSHHRQGAVWYAQEQAEDGSWKNMEQYTASASSWDHGTLQITRDSMTPGDSGKTAIGFHSPETGYIRMHLKNNAISDRPFTLHYSKETEEKGTQSFGTFDSVEEKGMFTTIDAAKYVYLPVNADDFIRVEASGTGNKISQIQPVISYISEETYQQALEGKLPAEIQIMGEPTVGTMLTAALLEGDLSSAGATYRWKADGINIPKATSGTFTPTTNELGKCLTVRLTSSDGTVVESAPSMAVAPKPLKNFVDDSDESISYIGFGNPGNREDAMNGTFHWSTNEVASNLKYTFTGTGVDVLTYTHSYWTRRQAVTIKNAQDEIVATGLADCHGADMGKTVAYSINDLPYGTYTIEIINDGTKNKIEFDGFYIYTIEDEPSDPYETYPVSYTGGDGAIGNAPLGESYSEGHEFQLPENTFTRNGYAFLGWNDGTHTYPAGTVYLMPEKPVEFRAVWKDITPPKPPVVEKPSKVTGVKAVTNKTDRIKISWEKAGNAEKYILERYDSTSGKWKSLKTTSGLSYTDKKLKFGTIYKYRVKGCRQIGSEMLTGESSVTFTTATAPKKPSLSYKKSGRNKVKLIWKKNTRADRFEVYRKIGKGSYKMITTKPSKAVSHTASALKKKKSCQFKIRGYKKIGKTKVYSAYSKPIKIKIK